MFLWFSQNLWFWKKKSTSPQSFVFVKFPLYPFMNINKFYKVIIVQNEIAKTWHVAPLHKVYKKIQKAYNTYNQHGGAKQSSFHLHIQIHWNCNTNMVHAEYVQLETIQKTSGGLMQFLHNSSPLPHFCHENYASTSNKVCTWVAYLPCVDVSDTHVDPGHLSKLCKWVYPRLRVSSPVYQCVFIQMPPLHHLHILILTHPYIHYKALSCA